MMNDTDLNAILATVIESCKKEQVIKGYNQKYNR